MYHWVYMYAPKQKMGLWSDYRTEWEMPTDNPEPSSCVTLNSSYQKQQRKEKKVAVQNLTDKHATPNNKFAYGFLLLNQNTNLLKRFNQNISNFKIMF